MTSMLASRYVGRSLVYVTTAERENVTRYIVRAAATTSRNGLEIGSMATLEEARRYMDAISPRMGLITAG